MDCRRITKTCAATIAVVQLVFFIDLVSADDTEYHLIRNLLANYDSRIRPSLNASESLNVTFGLALAQIIDVDEKNQIITTNCWLNQAWIDYKLRWDPDQYGGVKVVRLPHDTIWKPDILLYNNADVSAYKSSISTNVIVTSDGNVTWLSMMIFRSSCAIDVRYFPFDEQNCSMLFASWTYDGYQLNLIKVGDDGDTSNYIPNSEWTLVQLHAARHEVFYSCCAEPYPDITYTIQMRRKPLFYVFNMILPCLLITLVALLGFYIPSDSGEKVTMGITTLLSMTVFLMLVAENMPATSDVLPLVGLYYGITIAIVSLATAMTSFTLNIHHKGFNGQPVPLVIKFICFKILAKVMCLRIRTSVNQSPDVEAMFHRKKSKRKSYTKMNCVKRKMDGFRTDGRTSMSILDFVTSSDAVESVGLYDLHERDGRANGGGSGGSGGNGGGNHPTIPTTSDRHGRRRTFSAAAVIANASAVSGSTSAPSCPTCSSFRGLPLNNVGGSMIDIGTRYSNSTTAGVGAGTDSLFGHVLSGQLEQQLAQTLNKICRTIERSESRIETQEKKDDMRLEWQQVAMVIDRLLLLIFIVATLSITAAILLHAPLSRDFLFGMNSADSGTAAGEDNRTTDENTSAT